MNLHFQQLDNSEKYRLLYVLDHEQIAQFAQNEFKNKNIATIFFYVFLMSCFGFLGAKVAIDLVGEKETWDTIFSGLGSGFALCFLVIILVHECLHVLAYRITGAKDTAIKANWKQFVFIAVADKFVASGKEFYFIALLPFLVINSLLIIGLVLFNGFEFYLCMGTLLLHSLACGGDFALVSFLWENRHKQIVTYDDVPEKKSYFYEIL
jgi:hypothetical protein